MSCKGLHCPGCGDSGGGGVLALVAIVIVGAVIARPVVHAADELLHLMLIIAATTAGLVLLSIGAWGAWRIRRHVTELRAEARQVAAGRVSVSIDGRPVRAIMSTHKQVPVVIPDRRHDRQR
jgi:type VI protein secretion system component VasK